MSDLLGIRHWPSGVMIVAAAVVSEVVVDVVLFVVAIAASN